MVGFSLEKAHNCNKEALGFSGYRTLRWILPLIKYVDTKAKCRHLNKYVCKGTLRQVFIRDTVSHVGIFDPAS